MRILFLITKSEIGGAQRFVQEQLIVCKENQWEGYLITNKRGWLTDNSDHLTINVGLHNGIESKFSLSFLRFLCRFVKSNKIELIVCNSANGGLYGRVAGFLGGKKSIYVSHGWSSIYNGGKFTIILNLIERGLSILGDSVLCVSERDWNVALNTIKIKAEKIKLISNSIFPVERKLDFNDSNDFVKILMVCRIDHPKRVDLMVDAVLSLNKKVQLTIVGGGKHLNSIREKIKVEGESQILLKGEVAGFSDFKNYDAFALISESEGLPISAIEAMSAGLALILSNVGGCPALIKGNGVLVSNDIDSIKKGIVKCIANLNVFQKKSIEVFDRDFNLVINGKQYIKYYNSILSK